MHIEAAHLALKGGETSEIPLVLLSRLGQRK